MVAHADHGGAQVAVAAIVAPVITALFPTLLARFAAVCTLTPVLAAAVAPTLGTLGGLGLVLATPLLAMMMIGVQKIYIEDVLGDRDHAENAPPIETIEAAAEFLAPDTDKTETDPVQ